MNRIYEMNNLSKRKAKDIDLKEIFLVIKRRLWLILILTIITTGASAYYSYLNNAPLYQSSSRIIIEANPENRNTLQVIIKDSIVLDKVVKELGLSQSVESLAGRITVASVDNSQVVSISVTDTDPNRAADIANTTAKIYKQEIPTIMDFNDVRLLSDAKVNPLPINQSQNKLILIGFIAGLVIGIGLVFLLDSLDDSLRSEREVEEMLGLPVLGRVPKMHKRNLKKKNITQIELEVGGETIGYK
ncbi:lipopolysaccharide biosynthesis protein [Neobacillus bataviensis LMG 21833]|uniref:Lipopolysaccharide biosynthesis protein n=1 Tax=Neobacillus bataviensis LMG 21833 TaxID=1117379 RepID=K6DMK6_9BACI|nr:Wzz/FepE/Etk N-terminal domain-containing protein [Neobacillus bataviensis]EKN69408.1 lipopolysaccharide biosynthesis protein [Neobacillus bataviensis LMG 21833]